VESEPEPAHVEPAPEPVPEPVPEGVEPGSGPGLDCRSLEEADDDLPSQSEPELRVGSEAPLSELPQLWSCRAEAEEEEGEEERVDGAGRLPSRACSSGRFPCRPNLGASGSWDAAPPLAPAATETASGGTASGARRGSVAPVAPPPAAATSPMSSIQTPAIKASLPAARA